MPPSKKIMIVDDGRAARAWAASLLSHDYLTAQAADGHEALEKLAAFRPDMVLLDVEMPRLDGLETCRRIRANPEFRFIKIIFVSAYVSLEDRLAGYQAGGDDYITKPYDEGELLAKVRTMLRLKNEEELNQLKSDFLSLISHETRTPVNGIIGCAEALRNASTDDKTRGLAECVLRSGKHLHGLIENVILICRLKSSPDLTRNRQPTNIRQLLNEQLEINADNLQRKDLVVNLTGAADARIAASRPLLDKGFNCVLDNAVKFSPPAGLIAIDIAELGEQVVVRISDQGPGIKAEMLDTIFNEFAIPDINHHHKGLGISLAIAKQIFEQHGGSIHAENRGQATGAVFTITLPLAS